MLKSRVEIYKNIPLFKLYYIIVSGKGWKLIRLRSKLKVY